MPSIERMDDGSVVAKGVVELIDDQNPDDPNVHTFKTMGKYLRAMRDPEAWHKNCGRRQVEGRDPFSLLYGAPRPFTLGVDDDGV